MLQKNEILQKLQNISPILKEKYNLDQIGLFGSYVRNEATEESVIDLLISFNKQVGWELVDIKDYLKDVFGKEINIVTPSGLKKELRDTVLKEVVYI